MKYAIFKCQKYQYETIDNKHFEKVSGYIRMSEYVDVEFPPLPDEEVIPLEIAALDKERDDELAKHLTKLENIAERKSKLLALPHQEQCNETG